MLDSRIDKTLGALRSAGSLPMAIELWNGRRYELGGEPRVRLMIPDRSALLCLANGDLDTIGEAYVEGRIDVEGPIRDAVCSAAEISRLRAAARGRRPRWFNVHTRRRDAEAIRYHYDVSDDFYALWLDRRMVYSCAYFRTGDEDIDSAQAQKLDHICRKLALEPGQRLLDIGCGWGALVLWAAQHYGVDATGITLSRNQYEFANQRIGAAGLAGRCRVLLQDYRDLRGADAYDRIVSVGMFEHVGLKNLPAYFSTIRRLLAPGGVALNHGITAVDPDSRWVAAGGGGFVDKYVFPHGELPHLGLVVRAMGAAGLEVADVETLRLHYAKTLWHWSDRLEANAAQARALVGEKRFRIWRIYLAGCAHAFESNWVTIQQVLVTRGADSKNSPLPLTRDYMYQPAPLPPVPSGRNPGQ